jgi:adenine-specific DNA methylase
MMLRPRPAPGNSGRYLDLGFDKLRGGYYTPDALAAWLCAWAIRSPGDAVLEPSCGDGAFVAAAAARLAALGATAPRLLGLEVVPREAAAARARLHAGPEAAVQEGDFFAWWQQPGRPAFDVVVGNPPFIRYQTFPEPYRGRAMEILGGLGLRPSRLTNIWAAFVAAAAATLRPGGRLALVLPAELLQVGYAAPLRAYLVDRFARLDLVSLNELCFAGAEQEVVLLLADGAAPDPAPGRACRVALTEAATVQDLVARPPAEVLAPAEPKVVQHDHEKWLKYFLSVREIDLLRALRASGVAAPLSAHATVDVGVVTGRNAFFVLGDAAVRQRGLQGHTVPVVSRAAQLRGAIFGPEDWQALAAAGVDRVHLLHLAPLAGARPGEALAAYLRQGEQDGVPDGYKCSIRDPWYAVPSVWVPDGLLLRQIHAFPRVILNRAGATTTDTIHRLRTAGRADLLIASLHTHLTAASAEIEGRSYGGGVLELEPTEAERLLVPATIGAALPLEALDRLVRAGRLGEALAENDRVVLREGLGLGLAECAALRGVWEKLRGRRQGRRRTATVAARQVPSRDEGSVG